MNEEIDCDYTDEIVCPYCGYKHQDSWEMYDFGDESSDGVCGQCAERFSINISYTTSFSTEKAVVCSTCNEKVTSSFVDERKEIDGKYYYTYICKDCSWENTKKEWAERDRIEEINAKEELK